MPNRALRETLWFAAALLCSVIYFLYFTRHGLAMWMSNDDLMNIQFLHGWNRVSIWQLTLDSLLVASPAYRPFAGVVYRVMFDLFGLHPLPYRLLCFGLLTLNLGLAARFFYLLNPHKAAAALAVLIFSFHTCLAALYFETSTIYDILCFTFGVGAVVVYLGARQRLVDLNGGRWAAFVALYFLALDCKEMAISLPLALVVYEVVYHWGELGFRSWKGTWLALLVTATVTAAFSVAKVVVPSAMSINPLYQPRISPAFILEQLRHYYSLLLWDAPVKLPGLLLSLAALLVLAGILRNRPMLFGFWFSNLALIPVSVIPGRDGFVWYLPYLGWALYAAAAMVNVVDRLPTRTATGRPYSYGGLFALTLALLIGVQRKPARTFADRFDQDQRPLQRLLETARRELPRLRPGARVLVAEDHFEGVAWQPLFLFRLAYHDPTLWVDRPAHVMDAFYDPADLSLYDAVVYAKEDPVRISASPAQLDRAPALLKINLLQPGPGEHRLVLEAHDQANCSLDVETYLPDDVLQRLAVVRNLCTLDSAGRCEIVVKPQAQRGQLQRVRFCGRTWQPASPTWIYINNRY